VIVEAAAGLADAGHHQNQLELSEPELVTASFVAI
jgi:hypothetical protein